MHKKQILLLSVLLLLAGLALTISSCDYITGKAIESSVQAPAGEPVIKNVSPTDAYGIIAKNAGQANFFIIDVRTPEEYADGHIPGAINRNLNAPTFRDDIDKFDKNNIYIIYCRTGVRSAAARDIMKELGFKNIINVTGGYVEWLAQGFPVVK
jgi:phage shock protein E